ncbi:MAG: hypothetical protein RI560_03435 [Natronomonas sp.]|nr:hypothetical protein [Natronomonas sp.]MDR9380711.1 hypothetical protein [Natronomonas sp.]MDR9431518.1 hypothetical protein [Natronomonas sp.]
MIDVLALSWTEALVVAWALAGVGSIGYGIGRVHGANEQVRGDSA